MSSIAKCRLCQGNYLDHINNNKSQYHNQYLQHLGFCSNDCWDHLTKRGKAYCWTFNDCYGDMLKKHNIKIDKKHLLTT